MTQRPAWIALLLLACGGPKTAGPREPSAAAAEPDAAAAPAAGEPDASAPAAAPQVPPSEPAATVLTFELRNEGAGDLVFTIDKGWQPVLFAYTGKPPKAKPALLFPTACTGPCVGTPEEMCPVCVESSDPRTRKKVEKEETKREVAPTGGSVKVPWDGKVFAYQKAPPLVKKRCQCWTKEDPTPDTYTIKACGLRPSSSPGKPSKTVCVETQVALPATSPTIVLSFK